MLYIDYLVYNYGLDGFTTNGDSLITCSEGNRDGIRPSVADLVYWVRIMTGDETPFPRLNPPYTDSVSISVAGGVVSSESEVDLGALLLEFYVPEGQTYTPTLLAVGVNLKSDSGSGRLRVLIWGDDTSHIPAGSNELFSVDGDISLVEASASTYDGVLMLVWNGAWVEGP
jgi:hypothetical protein